MLSYSYANLKNIQLVVFHPAAKSSGFFDSLRTTVLTYKIVSSLVTDIISPILGVIMGGMNFTDIKITLIQAVLSERGKVLKEAVTINIGNFLQVVFDFTIVAFSLFVAIKALNILRRNSSSVLTKPKNH